MKKMEIGTTYWVTGLSGAGKTTIGSLLYNYLRNMKASVVFLDGDLLRDVFRNKDYSIEGRIKLTYQHGRLCRMLNEQGLDVVICVIAMFDECREWNRNNIENYFEIYLKVDMEELIRRDQKGLYSRAIKKEIDNVMGMDIPFEEPKNPNLVINNNGNESVEQVLDKIIACFNLD